MKKKITISIEKRILEEIEQHAKYENRTLSNYIEQTMFKSFSNALQEIIMQMIEIDKKPGIKTIKDLSAEKEVQKQRTTN